jgi:hypothetical protein
MDGLVYRRQEMERFMMQQLGHHSVTLEQNGSMIRDIDGMSYDELLSAFGDGSDLRGGAHEGEIDGLPTSVVVAELLPVEARQCPVCLEDFTTGECRKILPCLHGFHRTCIDQWLRSNRTCPICKHDIRGES